MYLSCPRGLEPPGARVQGTWGFQCGVAIRAPSAVCPGPPPPACRCSPLGAASAQCHENSTCVCKPGFVGYKCDLCQDNFFLTAGGTNCQECPSCYALVKKEVSPPHPGPAQGRCTFCSFHAPSEHQLCAGHREMPTYPQLSGLRGPPATSFLCPPSHLAQPHLCPSLAPERTGER